MLDILPSVRESLLSVTACHLGIDLRCRMESERLACRPIVFVVSYLLVM